MTSQIQYDVAWTQRVETMYSTPDVIAQRQAVQAAIAAQPGEIVEEAFCRELLSWLARRAVTLDVSPRDQELWRQLGDVDAPNYILRSPDFNYREAMILVVAEVP